MSSNLRHVVRRTLRRQGFRVQRAMQQRGWDLHRIDEETMRYSLTSYNSSVPLPPGAAEYLRADNPYLLELKAAYDALDVRAAAPSLWIDAFVDDQVALPYFRGDNAYVWQYRMLKSAAHARMYLMLLDVQSRDELGLLKRAEDDGLFGAWTFQFGDRAPVSRDLLDSAGELNYLERQLGLSSKSDLSILDIGAGYGRLAHRATEAFGNLQAYDCMDGVAHSTFLSDYYLKFREVPEGVRALRLDRHEDMRGDYSVAVNVHSFTECPYDAIDWWLSRVAERDIEWLFIVPNHPTEFLSTERDGRRRDFSDLIAKAGFTLADSRPRHENDEMRRLIDFHDMFYLFRR